MSLDTNCAFVYHVYAFAAIAELPFPVSLEIGFVERMAENDLGSNASTTTTTTTPLCLVNGVVAAERQQLRINGLAMQLRVMDPWHLEQHDVPCSHDHDHIVL